MKHLPSPAKEPNPRHKHLSKHILCVCAPPLTITDLAAFNRGLTGSCGVPSEITLRLYIMNILDIMDIMESYQWPGWRCSGQIPLFVVEKGDYYKRSYLLTWLVCVKFTLYLEPKKTERPARLKTSTGSLVESRRGQERRGLMMQMNTPGNVGEKGI